MANNKCFGGCLWPFEVLFNLVPLSSHLLRPYTFLVMKHDASDILRNTGLPVSCSGRIRALYLPQWISLVSYYYQSFTYVQSDFGSVPLYGKDSLHSRTLTWRLAVSIPGLLEAWGSQKNHFEMKPYEYVCHSLTWRLAASIWIAGAVRRKNHFEMRPDDETVTGVPFCRLILMIYCTYRPIILQSS